MNDNYKQRIYFNIFSRKFIFSFRDDFSSEVDATSAVFSEHNLSDAYLIACHFKVIDMLYKFDFTVCICYNFILLLLLY
jgi:hypothetical protein